MKLGVVAETQRLPDSPDTVLVVEPNTGATARTKGNLYLLVTGAGGRKLRDATRLVAERIRDEYYYDESAGIAVCLQKAIKAANKRLLHATDRMVTPSSDPGPIGLAAAVVRGSELYVVTLGPAEAYLLRQARLLVLPDPSPDGGLPAEEVATPKVWHGDMLVGDSLVLVSPNITRRLGLTPVQDAVVQLHPQSAVEQIHRQLTGGGIGSTGGDGIIAIEASEVAPTTKTQPLKPAWPSDSRAGAPERSPIPLADTVSAGAVAVQTSARQAQRSADGMLRRAAYSLFDRMPKRPTARGRVMSLAMRQERQRRAAAAGVSMLLVLAVVGAGLYYLGGTRHEQNIDAQRQGQEAYRAAQEDIDAVFGSGRDLVASDPEKAAGLLTHAYHELQVAQDNGYPEAQLADMRAKVIAGLNRYYHVTYVAPQVALSFGGDDLQGLVLGSDGCAYVIDKTAETVFQVNLAAGTKVAIAFKGEEPVGGGIVASPRLLAVGGPDVLILDDTNSLWRWRSTAGDKTGRGVLVRVRIDDSSTWGSGVMGIATYVTNADLGQYSIYAVVSSQQQVLKYPAASDGSGYPTAARANYLAVAQDVSNVDAIYIDGSVYLLNRGKIERFDSGQAIRGWSAASPGDSDLRPGNPSYTRLAADNPAPDQGNFYAYDGVNRRVVVFRKSDGSYVGQYLVPSTSPRLTDVRGMMIVAGPEGADPVLYWIESGDLMMASLTGAAPSPSPSASASGSAPAPSGSSSTKPSASP
jgi:hypothetical protein